MSARVGRTRPLRARRTPDTHRTHLRGTPAPQPGSRGPRFQPKAGSRARRKEKAAVGASGLRRAARPSPASASPTPSFPTGLRPPPSTRPQDLALQGPGARRTPAAALHARPARSSGGPGEGRTRRPGQGERPAPLTRPAAPARELPLTQPKLRDRWISLLRRRKKGCSRAPPEVAANLGAPGSPLQRREGVEPSGRVSRGRHERGQSRRSLQLARPTAAPARSLHGLFQVVPWSAEPLKQPVSQSRESILGLPQNLFCFVVVKGRGSDASQNICFGAHFAKPVTQAPEGRELQTSLELQMARSIPLYM